MTINHRVNVIVSETVHSSLRTYYCVPYGIWESQAVIDCLYDLVKHVKRIG